MLHDFFARRYADVPLRDTFEQRDSGLIVQAFRIISEDIYPYYRGGKENEANVAFWTGLEKSVSRELGMRELSPHWAGGFKWTINKICENWMVQPVSGFPDVHIKERLSLVEMAFRSRENQLNFLNANPITVWEAQHARSQQFGPKLPGDGFAAAQALRDKERATFAGQVNELNVRFRQAAYTLHYHNGFIQLSTDELVQQEIETPFWAIISAPIWKNVDTDMKEALDLRDRGGRDPVFYAARALESAIKIISDQRGWTHGGEKGAVNYIENLASRKSGFIEPWEGDVLKDFFSDVRNPFGHGAGSAVMPYLTGPQTEWAIEFAMSWIKSLIRRL